MPFVRDCWSTKRLTLFVPLLNRCQDTVTAVIVLHTHMLSFKHTCKLAHTGKWHTLVYGLSMSSYTLTSCFTHTQTHAHTDTHTRTHIEMSIMICSESSAIPKYEQKAFIAPLSHRCHALAFLLPLSFMLLVVLTYIKQKRLMLPII